LCAGVRIIVLLSLSLGFLLSFCTVVIIIVPAADMVLVAEVFPQNFK
jgi:hypothetical protein